jgi:hypothetical protein
MFNNRNFVFKNKNKRFNWYGTLNVLEIEQESKSIFLCGWVKGKS